MSKCPKCGTEFEGIFCPNCGTKYSETLSHSESSSSDVTFPSSRVCRNCGSVVEGRFCTVCGVEYSPQNTCKNCGAMFEGAYCPKCGARATTGTVRRTIQVSPAVQKKYWALSRFPLILFFTLSILLACAYFGDYCFYLSSNRYGYSYHWYNIYYMYDDLALYLFVFLMTCSATSLVLFIIGMANGSKKYTNYNLAQIFGIVGIVFMSISFVNGAVAWAVHGDYSANIMISAFSEACLIPSIICLVQSKLIVHNSKEYAAAEYKDSHRKENRARPNW